MTYLYRVILVVLLIASIFLGYLSYEMELKIKDLEQQSVKPIFMQDVVLPHEFDFCGESVPMNDPEVRERFDFELVVNVHLHARTMLVLKRAHRWFPQIEPILKEYNIPDDFKYLAVIESNLSNAVSPVGASGFWQFMDRTGKEFDLEITNEVDERYHVLKATRAACEYLQWAYNKTGSWTNAAAAYNAGVHGINKRLEKQQVTSYYDAIVPRETSRYIFRILALKEIMKNPTKYKFEMSEQNLYSKLPLRVVKVDATLADLQQFAIEQGTTYKLFKYYNPWLRKDKLTISKKDTSKVYEIFLPIDSKEGELHPAIQQKEIQEKDTISESKNEP